MWDQDQHQPVKMPMKLKLMVLVIQVHHHMVFLIRKLSARITKFIRNMVMGLKIIKDFFKIISIKVELILITMHDLQYIILTQNTKQ